MTKQLANILSVLGSYYRRVRQMLWFWQDWVYLIHIIFTNTTRYVSQDSRLKQKQGQASV